LRAAEERIDPAAGGSWTLTWLEGRPIATLDDGTAVTLDGGTPVPQDAESDDEW
jgi:hypothetical protein